MTMRVRISYGDVTADIQLEAGYNPDILDDMVKQAQVSFILAMTHAAAEVTP